MSVTTIKKQSRGNDESKTFYTLARVRGDGQRAATGIFTYTNSKDQLQKNHIKEAQAILENKNPR